MNSSQLFSVIGAVALTIILFWLPRVVVENDPLQEVAATETHHLEIPLDARLSMKKLRKWMEKDGDLDQKTKYALSLANYYLDYGILDSAVALGGEIENWKDGASETASDIYFKAYERSQNQEEAKKYASRARKLIASLLHQDSANLLLKNKLAMTLSVTENPMSGIRLLKEILKKDQNYRPAILNLGLLSIQSGQYTHAKKRFEKLIRLDSADHEAKLYLAVSMIEINEPLQARLLLEEILNSKDSIPAVKMMAMEYWNGL